ncbi:MAG TPA: site-2 protease family protein [Methanoregulaceae archaeon]|nr:site-2 protease family protein [Methanoregulaceae archaeon]
MNWLLLLVLLVMVYAAIAFYVHRKKIYSDYIVFYGPILAIKTSRVQFFDWFRKYTRFLRLYASFGVVMVILISVAITILLFISLQFTLIIRPDPTGIYAPQNILLLPGINEYVPSTLAVWFAFVLTIAIHEMGHGILSRVENIKVKSMGALLMVIPIGFFVEPDEEELEKTRGMPKIRMFGAGITNNIIVGAVCFAAMILLMGAAVPTSEPVIQGVYKNYSADLAGVPSYSVITGIDGIDVNTRGQISAILNGTTPGQTVALTVLHEGLKKNYTLTLSQWPAELEQRDSGFMGIYYYNGGAIIDAIGGSLSPIGYLRLLTVPFDTSFGGQMLRIVAFDTPDMQFYEVPIPWFWGLVHLLFWSGWININVGIFNAIPMVPLDGGYILKEGVDRLFERRGLQKYAQPVVAFVSSLVLVMLISLIILPYIFQL